MQQRKTTTINDTAISYVQSGSGADTIMCIHGYGASSTYFAPLIDKLDNTFTVIAPDQPDFGNSQDTNRKLDIPQLADFHRKFAEQLKLSNYIVLAHSFGTQIAAELAKEQPNPISHLILMCPTVNPHESTFFEQALRYVQAAGKEQPPEIGQLLRDFKSAGLPRLLQTLQYVLHDRIEDKLPLIQMPTLVMYGDRDPICPAYWAKEVGSLLPHGKIFLIADGDHTFHFNQPLEVSKAVAHFVHQ